MKQNFLTLFAFVFLFLSSAKILNAQINLFGESKIGISIQNKNAMFRTKNPFCYGAGMGYLTDSKIIFSLEYQRTLFSDEMASIRDVSAHTLISGIGFSTMLKQKRIETLSGLSYSRVSFYSDENFTSKFFAFSKKSLWTQWGFKIATTYYFKPWFGASLTYSRFCDRRYDPENYQSFISLGVVMKWSHKPKATV